MSLNKQSIEWILLRGLTARCKSVKLLFLPTFSMFVPCFTVNFKTVTYKFHEFKEVLCNPSETFVLTWKKITLAAGYMLGVICPASIGWLGDLGRCELFTSPQFLHDSVRQAPRKEGHLLDRTQCFSSRLSLLSWPAWYKYPRLNSQNENAPFKGD